MKYACAFHFQEFSDFFQVPKLSVQVTNHYYVHCLSMLHCVNGKANSLHDVGLFDNEYIFLFYSVFKNV